MPFAVVFNPALDVLARRVMMSPVYKAASVVPFVFAEKSDRVAKPQTINTWCQIDIVSDEQRLTRFKFKDESLMPAAVIVISQNACDGTASLNLESRSPFTNRRYEFGVRRPGRRRLLRHTRGLFESVIRCDQSRDRNQEFF